MWDSINTKIKGMNAVNDGQHGFVENRSCLIKLTSCFIWFIIKSLLSVVTLSVTSYFQTFVGSFDFRQPDSFFSLFFCFFLWPKPSQ